MVYALTVRNMEADDRDTLDGWMTCTLDQAVEFIDRDKVHDQQDRLMAAKIAGVVG